MSSNGISENFLGDDLLSTVLLLCVSGHIQLQYLHLSRKNYFRTTDFRFPLAFNDHYVFKRVLKFSILSRFNNILT